ncbi:MAG TPA: hypothetical protein VFS65_01275 [Candidatus Saccharimonadales bacterium]|nr:hypothetical protein [Candidatus Saccharimonadales bacterium]
MTPDTLLPIKQPNESDVSWQKRAKKYIRQHAPASQRYYIRNGKRGNTKGRWVVPIFFAGVALFVLIFSLLLRSDFEILSGPGSAEGTFTVSSISEHTKRRGGKSYSPNINIRGEIVNVYNSSGHDFAVGQPIDVRYTTEGKPIASFTNEDGTISLTANHVGFIMSGIFIILSILTAVLPRGSVAPDYMDHALAELEAGRNLPASL